MPRLGSPLGLAFAAAGLLLGTAVSTGPAASTLPPQDVEAATRPVEETAPADRATALAEAFLQRRREALSTKLAEEREIAAADARLATEIEEQAAAAGPGTPEQDRLYDVLVTELTGARERLRGALAQRRSLGTDAWRESATAEESAAIEARRPRLEDAIGTVRDLETQVVWTAIELRGEQVRRLNALRIETLPRLSAGRRGEVLGLSRRGLAQLGREIGHLGLSARLYAASRIRDLGRLPSTLGDVVAMGAASWIAVKIAAILIAALWLRSRGRRIGDALRRAIYRRHRSVRWTRRFEGTLTLARAVAPWITWLVALWLIRRTIGTGGVWPEARVVYRLAFLYGVYRLAIDLAMAAIVQLAGRYRLRIDAARRLQLIRSVRTVMRVLASIAALLVLSEQFLGRGYLYHLVVDLAWVIVLFALVRVLASWRTTIADTYLGLAPDGGLAGAVRSTREHWYGVFVALVALLWLLGRAGGVLAHEFAMGFDQTRKALAFVFRRRMEKQAEKQGYAEGRLDRLPPAVLEAFTEEPATEGPLVVDHFPGFERFTRWAEAWKDGRGGGAFLVIGEPGMGKTSWLSRVAVEGATVSHLAFQDRVHSVGDLARVLSRGLGTDNGDLDRLRQQLLEGPPRVVTLDLCQNLFLGRVGGYDTFESFIGFVGETAPRVLWVAASNRFAWEHLESARPDLAVFRNGQVLPRWSEEEIRNLIRRRTGLCGMELTYEDLVVQKMEGVSTESRLIETEEGYARLLWDYAEGNPRVALHFWVRSLVPESETRARVRLFRAPTTDELEAKGETTLFLLAAIVVHENLTLDEASSVTRYPHRICRIHLERLFEDGVLRRDGRRYRITTHWQRAVLRLLERRNLVPV